MQIGVVFPQTEIGDDPVAIRDFAQAAEGLGYTHLLVYDHILGAVGEHREPPLTGFYSEKTPFHEVFVLLGYLAGLTSRIELATGVLVLPQRQTALVAKQAAEVDILSGGRLRLGVGVGWNYVEYEALNEDFSNRGRRQEEQVEVMRRLWAEPVVDFTGQVAPHRPGRHPAPARPPDPRVVRGLDRTGPRAGSPPGRRVHRRLPRRAGTDHRGRPTATGRGRP